MGYYTYPIPEKALHGIYENTQESIGKVLEKDHPYIVAAWRAMECILYTVDTEGVLALEDKLNDGIIARIGALNYEFLKKIIISCVDAYDKGLVLDMIVSDYYVNAYDDTEKACMFFCLVGIMEIMDRTPEYEMKYTAQKWMQKNLLLLPEQYRQGFAVCSNISCYAIKEEEACPWKELTMDLASDWKEEKSDYPWGISQEEFDREEDLKIEVLQQTKGITEEYFEQMKDAILTSYTLSVGAFKDGLLFVENYMKGLQETDSEEDLFLCDALQMMCRGQYDLRYCMIKKYENLERGAKKDWIRFLYMDAVAMIATGVRPREIKEACIGMLPAPYRKRCMEFF